MRNHIAVLLGNLIVLDLLETFPGSTECQHAEYYSTPFREKNLLTVRHLYFFSCRFGYTKACCGPRRGCLGWLIGRHFLTSSIYK